MILITKKMKNLEYKIKSKKEEETLINQKNIINSDEFDKRYTELKKINEYNIKNKEISESQKEI